MGLSTTEESLRRAIAIAISWGFLFCFQNPYLQHQRQSHSGHSLVSEWVSAGVKLRYGFGWLEIILDNISGGCGCGRHFAACHNQIFHISVTFCSGLKAPNPNLSWRGAKSNYQKQPFEVEIFYELKKKKNQWITIQTWHFSTTKWPFQLYIYIYILFGHILKLFSTHYLWYLLLILRK